MLFFATQNSHMKNYLPLFIFLFSIQSIVAQTFVSDSAVMGPGYANDVFISLANGTVKKSPNTNWQLAFRTGLQTDGIFIHPTKGQMYLSKKDTNAWKSLDSSADMLKQVFNTDTSWEIGALNQTYDNPYSSWGVYDAVSHVVKGDSLYIVSANIPGVGVVFRKLWIIKKDYGDWYIRLGSFNNSFDTTIVISNNAFKNRLFSYVNIVNGAILDREAADTSWDIVATRYAALQPNGQYYPSTGVLSNMKVQIAKVQGVNKNTYFDYASPSYKSAINTLGANWKVFDPNTSSYSITDSVVYFIKARNGNVYSLYFNSFSISSGVIGYSKTKLFTSGITEKENNLASMNIYPNPATESIYLLTDLATTIDNANIEIVNLNGQQVYSQSISKLDGFEAHKIDLTSINQGVYFVHLKSKNINLTSKLIISY